MKKYLQMNKTEKELIVKLILCTIISTLFSWSIGDLYSPTTAVTANLVLYIDRGYRGSIRYAARRVLVQIVQGILVLAFILPCKYLGLPVHDVVLIIVACCVSLVIGLPINYKTPYSPYNCTLANASFIVACIGIQSLAAFPRRVLECIVGGIIAYFVNFIIYPHRDRVGEIIKNIGADVADMVNNKSVATYNKNLEVVSKDIVFLLEDSEKALDKLKVPQETKDYMLYHQKLERVLYHYVLFYQENKQKFSRQFEQELQTHFQNAAEIHMNRLSGEEQPARLVAIPKISTQNAAEFAMLGRLVEYTAMVNKE